ncbi:MAG: transcriptional regulator [Thermoproteota archaeon]
MTEQKIPARESAKLLKKIRDSLERLNKKMKVMIELQKQDKRDLDVLPDVPLDVMTLLSMPDHLRKTAMVVCRMGRVTAQDVAEQTDRARAVESGYLNQLVVMGHLQKERVGRKAYFYVEGKSER